MDPEVKAMADIVTALEGRDEQTIARVLKWAVQRYQVPIGELSAKEDMPPHDQVRSRLPKQVEDFHELFEACNPSTATDRALVAAYWFQVVKGQDTLDSQQLNSELKNLGHQSSNITRDLDSLIGRNPSQIIQVRKDGKSKQARKRYRLTREGIKAVEGMLQSNEG